MSHKEKQAGIALRALQTAVARTLTIKRKLGHYAVMNKGGKAVRVPPAEIPSDQEKG